MNVIFEVDENIPYTAFDAHFILLFTFKLFIFKVVPTIVDFRRKYKNKIIMIITITSFYRTDNGLGGKIPIFLKPTKYMHWRGGLYPLMDMSSI